MDIVENVYCRLCAGLKPPNKLINLKIDEEKCREIVEKLTRFNLVNNLKDSILPKTVCFICLYLLERAFQFVTAVEQAYTALSDLNFEQIKDSDSENDNIVYEPPEFPEENYKNVSKKVESAKVDSISESVTLKNTKTSGVIKKKNNCNSLDTLPLSQVKLTWKDYNWMCTYCETQFPNIDELRNHSMQYHNTCNPYRCTECKIRKSRLDSFLMHVKRHRKYLKFSCYKCPETYRTILQGIKHKATHMTTNFICYGCNTNFTNRDELISHTRIFYRDKRPREIPVPSVPFHSNRTCLICNKTYKSRSGLDYHLLLHTERKKEHICEICGKSFFQKSILAEHMIQHTDARPYQCENCKSSFKTSRRLRCHLRVHNGQKPHACDQCGRCFRFKYLLNKHSIIHTDSLPHVCLYCNKGFRFKSVLDIHVRQHTGIQPYSCDICKRDFTNWPNYNKHMKRRHDMNMSRRKTHS